MHKLLYRFDGYVIDILRGWPQWLTPGMNVITFLGNPITVIVGMAALALYAYKIQRLPLLMGAVAVVGVIGVNSVLKEIFQRMRPNTEYVRNMFIDSFSFPSGHSAAAAVGFGFLAYLAWKLLPSPWGIPVAILLCLLILLVGISRVYLGAHYPSDVLGGWLVGLVGLALIIIVIKPLS